MVDEVTNYRKAPIVEAIFHIEAPSRSDLEPDIFQSTIHKMLDQNVFPEARTMHLIDFTVRASGEAGVTHTEDRSRWGGASFTSLSGEEVIQFRKEGMSYHRLAPYSSFEEVFPQFQKYWGIYSELAKPLATIRQGLRFINRIQLPIGSTFSDLGKFARITPKFALSGEWEPMNMLSRVQLKDPETGHVAMVSFSLGEPDSESPVLLFDIDVSCGISFAVNDESIWEHFEQLRGLKNQLFTGCLTKKCLNLFK